MSKITHISFDLWLTLIKSHPEFKKKRSELILVFFDLDDIDVMKIDTEIRRIDKIFDRYNEISGKNISANTMYERILTKIIPSEKSLSVDRIIKFREQADDLFLEYPPMFLNNNISSILSELTNMGFSLNISSNTGFIEGKILRKVLTEMDILKHFKFLVFSDEIGVSKPSSYFFQKVYNNIGGNKKQILHIGDNPKNDYKGAKSFGFEALLITNPNYTIDDIRTSL